MLFKSSASNGWSWAGAPAQAKRDGTCRHLVTRNSLLALRPGGMDLHALSWGREPEIWGRGRWCAGRGKAIGAAQRSASSSTGGDWRGPSDQQPFCLPMQCALWHENSPAEGANQAFPHSYGEPKTLRLHDSASSVPRLKGFPRCIQLAEWWTLGPAPGDCGRRRACKRSTA